MHIPPIKIQVTLRQLQCVNEILNQYTLKSKPQDREVNAVWSAIQQIKPKLQKKEISKYAALKPFFIKLHFYEADYLEKVLIDLNKIHKSHELQCFINLLNEKLI